MTLQRPLPNWLLTIVALAACTSAQAGYSNLFLFGDSLSDSGNNAAVLDYVIGPAVPPPDGPVPPGTLRTPVPTLNNSFVATYPYAYPSPALPLSGRYSNGKVWAETFAPAFGLSAVASELGGTNFAFGGARVAITAPSGFPPSLSAQLGGFLTKTGGVAPASALYVLEGGGNDARDIIAAAAAAKTPGDAAAIIEAGAIAYAAAVDAMVEQLEKAGAKDIVVWNTPNAGKAPEVIAAGGQDLGTFVSQTMNAFLLADLADDIVAGVKIFDAYGFITRVSNDPGAYGLVDAENACAAKANIAACAASGYQYFFWDGIHPTAEGHRLLANAMISLVPEPATVVLLAVGLFGVATTRRLRGVAPSRPVYSLTN
jgi:outer membrane lipase/esterase